MHVFESPFQALSNDSSTKQIGPMVLNLYDIEDYHTLIEMSSAKIKLDLPKFIMDYSFVKPVLIRFRYLF